MTSDSTASEAVLTAIAEREGVDELELREPLYETIDPDALDALFRDGRGRVTFEYLGYLVTVDQDGEVEVEEPTTRP